jgi:hypothetical protein
MKKQDIYVVQALHINSGVNRILGVATSLESVFHLVLMGTGCYCNARYFEKLGKNVFKAAVSQGNIQAVVFLYKTNLDENINYESDQ